MSWKFVVVPGWYSYILPAALCWKQAAFFFYIFSVFNLRLGNFQPFCSYVRTTWDWPSMSGQNGLHLLNSPSSSIDPKLRLVRRTNTHPCFYAVCCLYFEPTSDIRAHGGILGLVAAWTCAFSEGRNPRMDDSLYFHLAHCCPRSSAGSEN